MATSIVFSSSFALSGERTHPIRAPIQFLNGFPRPAALSYLVICTGPDDITHGHLRPEHCRISEPYKFASAPLLRLGTPCSISATVNTFLSILRKKVARSMYSMYTVVCPCVSHSAVSYYRRGRRLTLLVATSGVPYPGNHPPCSLPILPMIL